MYDRFSERARKVVIYAREEAAKMNYDFIGTEHILLGLLREGASIGVIVLRRMNIDITAVREELNKYLVTEEYKPNSEHDIQLTPRAKRVLELAVDEATKMGHNFVGTEHILLGLLREGEGIAARVLRVFNVTAEKVREEVVKLLSGEMESDYYANKKKVKSATPALDEFGRDLTKLAQEDKLDPVIGREHEIERVIQILARRKKNNPVLIGEAGVGKTAIVEGLAQRIVTNEVPDLLVNKRVVSLDLAAVIAGTKYRGQFEERFKAVMKEIQESENIIIFIDEIHTLVGAGAAEGAIDASNILKPSLSRGEIQCIGATTLDEYRKYIEKDAALERRFQKIIVEPPTVEETIEIVSGLRDKYEAHHAVKITDEAIVASSKLADRYLTERFLPDKAIDLIDEAAAMVRLTLSQLPKEIADIEKEIEQFKKDKSAAIMMQEFEKAAHLRDVEQKLKEHAKELKKNWLSSQTNNVKNVTAEDIAVLISKWTGIPLAKLEEKESERLMKIEDELNQHIIGQDEAIKVVANALRRARAGLKDPNRPIGTFIFLGPTGVGKTELARVLATFMFNDPDALIRVDMSEYMEKFSVSRLMGAPPGYVGYEEGGQLTEKVRRRPYSVVLFDEIEKAHPDVFNILLQVFEDGHLTDNVGRVIDFKNTIIILTSNIGAKYIWNKKSMGFTNKELAIDYPKMKDMVISEVKKIFNPEFINRLDELVVFNPLGRDEIIQIIDLLLANVRLRLQESHMDFLITEEMREFLVEVGYSPEFGARPLKRSIQRYIEDVIALEILSKKFIDGDTIKVDCRDGQVITERIENSILRSLMAEEKNEKK